MKITDEQLAGWKIVITPSGSAYDVMFQHQYQAVITSPEGNNLSTFPFGWDSIGIYAFTMNGAEKKAIKVLKKYLKDELNRKNARTKSL